MNIQESDCIDKLRELNKSNKDIIFKKCIDDVLRHIDSLKQNFNNKLLKLTEYEKLVSKFFAESCANQKNLVKEKESNKILENKNHFLENSNEIQKLKKENEALKQSIKKMFFKLKYFKETNNKLSSTNFNARLIKNLDNDPDLSYKNELLSVFSMREKIMGTDLLNPSFNINYNEGKKKLDKLFNFYKRLMNDDNDENDDNVKLKNSFQPTITSSNNATPINSMKMKIQNKFNNKNAKILNSKVSTSTINSLSQNYNTNTNQINTQSIKSSIDKNDKNESSVVNHIFYGTRKNSMIRAQTLTPSKQTIDNNEAKNVTNINASNLGTPSNRNQLLYESKVINKFDLDDQIRDIKKLVNNFKTNKVNEVKKSVKFDKKLLIPSTTANKSNKINKFNTNVSANNKQFKTKEVFPLTNKINVNNNLKISTNDYSKPFNKSINTNINSTKNSISKKNTLTLKSNINTERTERTDRSDKNNSIVNISQDSIVQNNKLYLKRLSTLKSEKNSSKNRENNSSSIQNCFDSLYSGFSNNNNVSDFKIVIDEDKGKKPNNALNMLKTIDEIKKMKRLSTIN